jgi:hypothetical protein
MYLLEMMVIIDKYQGSMKVKFVKKTELRFKQLLTKTGCSKETAEEL